MWGNTLIIDRLSPSAIQDDLRGKEEDKLILTWEQRRWMRGRFTTERGRKIGIALPVLGEVIAGVEGSASRDATWEVVRREINQFVLWPFNKAAALEFGPGCAETR